MRRGERRTCYEQEEGRGGGREKTEDIMRRSKRGGKEGRLREGEEVKGKRYRGEE